MGEDRGVSLDRGAEAVVPLRQAFDLAEALAKLDARDFSSRSRVGTSGRELGDILRWTAPHDALAVYHIAIGRLREVPNNIKARRDEALALAGSSYPLRALGRIDEAGARVDRALAILAATKDYPAEAVPIEGEAAAVLRAAADHRAARGERDAAIREFETLIAKVRAAHSDIDADLQNAYSLVETLRGHRAPATIERPGRGRSAIGSRSPRYLGLTGKPERPAAAPFNGNGRASNSCAAPSP